jgi:tetratricopeptide (TPR) repeat protein
MQENPEKINPAGFETITPADPALSQAIAPEARSSTENRWVPPVLTGLIVLAAIVIFWLPSAVDKPVLESPAGEQATAASQPTSSDSREPERSPWQEAQVSKVRKEAQDVLGDLLDLQFELEEQGVRQWAAEAFAAAQQIAVVADELYRDKDFAAARDAYKESLQALQTITLTSDEIFTEAMQRGQTALAELDGTVAQTAFTQALQIKPDDIEAHQGALRAERVEQLLNLVQQADILQQRGQLSEAKELLQQASSLDPDYSGANAQIAAIDEQLTDQRFNNAMSAGYEALQNGNFVTAEKNFRTATSLRPQAGEAQTALREARDSRSLRNIEVTRLRAEKAESEERWQAAREDYQSLLRNDSTLVFARVGAIRAGARADLNQGLVEAIESPERLADPAAFRAARTLFRDASTLENKGPLLQSQIEKLAVVLEEATKPKLVELRSDQQTEVTLRKVAVLGTFVSQTLSLKPGTYVAVGVRRGYRDVRKEFTVAAGMDTSPITIQCTEPI